MLSDEQPELFFDNDFGYYVTGGLNYLLICTTVDKTSTLLVRIPFNVLGSSGMVDDMEIYAD